MKLQIAVSWAFFRLFAPLELLILRCAVKLRVHGKHNLQGLNKTPVLLVANHISLLDAWVVTAALAHKWIWHIRWIPWTLAAKELYCSTWWKRAIFYIHRAVVVERYGDSETKKHALNNGKQLLERGQRFLVFPEGTRSRNGSLSKLKLGAALTADQVEGCVILPVYLKGTDKALPRGSTRLRTDVEVDVYFDEPFDPSRYSGPVEVTEEIKRRLLNMEQLFYCGAAGSEPASVAPSSPAR